MSKKGLDEKIKAQVSSAIDEMEENRLKEALDTGEPIDVGSVDGEEDLQNILSSFASSEGYYGKLFRKKSDGRYALMPYVFDMLEKIDDPEIAISELVKERKWQGGEYILHIMKRGERNFKKAISINIENDLQPTTQVNDMSSLKEAIYTMKELTGTSIVDTYKTAFEVAKSMFADKPSKDTGILEIIAVLEKLGLIAKPIPVVERKEKTLVEQITEMKAMQEALGIGGKEDKDILSQLTEFKQLGEVLGWTDGGSPTKPINLLIQTLVPRIPDLIKSISEPIKALIQLQQMKLLGGKSPIGTTPVPPLSSLPSPVPPDSAGQEVHTSLEGNGKGDKIKIFIGELKEMIEAGNKDFPYILSGINYTFGSDFIQQYFAGTLDKNSIRSILQYQDAYFNEQKAIDYVDRFFEYVDSIKEASNAKMYKCDKCTENFELTDTEFKEDNKCECGGILSLAEAMIES